MRVGVWGEGVWGEGRYGRVRVGCGVRVCG